MECTLRRGLCKVFFNRHAKFLGAPTVAPKPTPAKAKQYNALRMGGQRILVVDDDAQVRLFLCRFLEDAGYVVDSAEDGEVALERIGASRPDLISLDLVMPGLDGWAVIERLETMADPPPVLLLTGQGAPQEGRRLRAPVAGIVHKGEDPRMFLEACRRVLAGPVPDDSSARGAERRRARRRPLVVPVHVATLRGMVLAEGRLVRLSPIGADLEVDAPLQAADTVRLSMLLPAREAPWVVDGQLHPRGRSAHAYVYGVSFVGAPADLQKLLETML
jgi:CheY-like chemotaxis protein